MTTMWVGQAGGILVGNILGVAIARRLNARVTTLVLSVTAIAQAAEFVLHLIYGIQSVQSGPTHLAVMLASLLGVGVGVIASRHGLASASESADEVQVVEEPGRGVSQRVRASLQLRPA
jgi:uncharacterized membrane protein YqgA involved in biofilm formation